MKKGAGIGAGIGVATGVVVGVGVKAKTEELAGRKTDEIPSNGKTEGDRMFSRDEIKNAVNNHISVDEIENILTNRQIQKNEENMKRNNDRFEEVKEVRV